MITVQGLLLDVEGVLVADKRYRPVAGAPEFVARMRRQQLPMRLITNNTTDAPPALLAKLRDAGFDFAPHELYTCTTAAVRYLRREGAARCLVVGSEALRGLLAEAGLHPLDHSRVDAVVVGLDTRLTYERLRLACEAILDHGARFVALHRNRLFPDDQGRRSPSVGPIVAALVEATRQQPVVVGKPSAEFYAPALADLDLPSDRVLVVSDDPFSDLVGALWMGMRAAFVMSGKYTDPDVLKGFDSHEQPNVVVPAIADLLTCGAVEFVRPG
jgi:HAD superfamily hydrolase (TIGR01450 family)